MPFAVEVTELTKVINEKILVDRISFSVEDGEIFGLLGSNGSGKTTTFNMLSGLLTPSSGTITILGKNIKELQKSKSEIGMVTQENSFYETLTVRENLEFFASQFGVSGEQTKERIKKLLGQMKLADKIDVMASKLSGGTKKRLNMACALMHDPKIIFLDEPTVGLDPIVRKEIWAVINELHKTKKTIIITSHYMEEIDYLCNRVVIMFAGKVVAYGTPAELKTKYKLKQMEDVFAHLMKPGI
ncbi:ABC transporter ATP-binding protein [Candidatus Micrarchaeota archaeon]|nr:ABC transporter ATP-binding protein [Candidatus Micrarchaeota archaeon]MBU1165606.1 ABC transporter ATP-binding protein [Candidatus Micrarchaeota archaeon]MBU1887163.1 ABC transporter ATP-binding protein [Candidatus Micrarchaeota archaeon]